MKIIHVITCLDDGGAEAVLVRLVNQLPNDQHFVASLSGLGKFGKGLVDQGVQVFDLNMTSFPGKTLALFRLIQLIKRVKPDVVQTWMYHADFIGSLGAWLAGVRNIVWGIHNSMVSLDDNTLRRYVLIRVNALLSKVIPKAIISCSSAALRAHEGIGYASKKLIFIPNGYPTQEFYPDKKKRAKIRAEFGISPNELLLGMVARLDPQKDHHNLLKSLAELKVSRPFKCLLVGRGLDQASDLLPAIAALGLDDQVLLAGQRTDIPAVMNALDIFCLSSAYSEAFPNVLCEAMACSVPCVATDVGDSALIIGNTGWVVPRRSPDLFRKALEQAIHCVPDVGRSAAARERIVRNFSIEQMALSYRKVWLDLPC